LYLRIYQDIEIIPDLAQMSKLQHIVQWGASPSPNYKTAMTGLNGLVDKGVLARQKSGRVFIYTATASRQDLLAGVFGRRVSGMLGDELRQMTLTQMVETAEAVDPDILEELSRLIRQKPAHE
jgi:predicted transcriptional regulator